MAGSMIRGEAEVLESSRPEPRTREDDTAGEFDVADFGVGRHSLRLEVRLPGHDPYEVDARFKVPVEKTRQHHPEQHAQMSASAKSTAESWSASVSAGAMSREQFEESIARYVQLGFLQAEDAEAFRESLDGPSAGPPG